MLELPARVVLPENLLHGLVTDHVAELVVEELRLRVDHHIVGREVAKLVAHGADRLRPSVQVEVEDEPPYPRIRVEAGHVLLEIPCRLEAREALVEEPLLPLVIGEDSHQVVVADLVQNQAEAGAPIHHDHGELGSATLDAVHVRHLWPRIGTEQFVQPAKRLLSSPHRNADPPGESVGG